LAGPSWPHRDLPPNTQECAAFTGLERQVLKDAMARLPVEYRAVIRRAYYRGMSTEQIAEDLTLAECEVKCRLHYGLRRLLILVTINGFQ
jgi:RNA polymerase sigma-70 factor (ECF subfamily)